MKNIDFVIVGLQPWDIEIGSNCKNIAIELAKKSRVLYVNRALDRFSAIRYRRDAKVKARLRAWRGQEPPLQIVQENLWVLNPPIILESINWIKLSILFDYLNKMNAVRLSRVINQSITDLGFDCTVLLIDNDFFRGYYLKELTKNDITGYYIRDYLVEQKYFRTHGARLEHALIDKVDVVFANSSYLARYASQYNQHAYDVGQGCDLMVFAESPKTVPEELLSLQRPIIGYVGALLSSRLDISLIDALSQECPGWSIVLVGPEDTTFRNSVLHTRPNVYFLGEKAGKHVPAYIGGFDVCINPQLVNATTRGNYPRKIDEYLAAGKPVVATATEAMQLFAEQVHLCNGVAEYVEAIAQALKTKDDHHLVESRKKVAFSHTWESSVVKMESYLQQFINETD